MIRRFLGGKPVSTQPRRLRFHRKFTVFLSKFSLSFYTDCHPGSRFQALLQKHPLRLSFYRKITSIVRLSFWQIFCRNCPRFRKKNTFLDPFSGANYAGSGFQDLSPTRGNKAIFLPIVYARELIPPPPCGERGGGVAYTLKNKTVKV